MSLGLVEENGKSEWKRNRSLVRGVKAVQPNAPSPPHSQPGVAKATLTLCKPHSKQVTRRRELLKLHYISQCARACTYAYVCVCVCVPICCMDQACECLLLQSRLTVYSGLVVFACELFCALLHEQACCIIDHYLHSALTKDGNPGFVSHSCSHLCHCEDFMNRNKCTIFTLLKCNYAAYLPVKVTRWKLPF